MLSGKNILIFGGLGFIGSNLANLCNDMGAIVTIVDNLDPDCGGSLDNILEKGGAIKIITESMLNYEKISDVVKNQNIIFNLAAATSHKLSMEKPIINTKINCLGVINVLEAIRNFNISSKFIHVGTTSQLGKIKISPANEMHPEFPLDIYSANKTASEKYVMIYSQSYKMKCTVARFSNVFGPRSSINNANLTFNNYFIGQALKNDYINIYGTGNQIRNSLYVDDAVNALIMMASSDETNGHIFMATHDEHHSVKEIAEETINCFGAGKLKYTPWPKGKLEIEIGDVFFDNSKIKNFLQWQPNYSLREGLLKSAEFYNSKKDV